jgi:osmotically-inducible protein OsmY
MIACARACADRYDTNRNLPPRSNEPANTKHDLKPNDTPTPGTASGTASSTKDRQITDNVEHALMADKTLSASAKNVKVETENGVVTLRGPVATEQEKKMVADRAMQVAGVMRVENQTDVMPIR